MANIAGYTFTEWRGSVPPMANQVDVRERAGTDGYTFALRGKRSPAFQVQTTSLHADLAAARSRCGDYEALIGSFVTIEDSAGRGFGKVIVLNVVASAAQLLFATDGSRAKVDASWTLQRGR